MPTRTRLMLLTAYGNYWTPRACYMAALRVYTDHFPLPATERQAGETLPTYIRRLLSGVPRGAFSLYVGREPKHCRPRRSLYFDGLARVGMWQRRIRRQQPPAPARNLVDEILERAPAVLGRAGGFRLVRPAQRPR